MARKATEEEKRIARQRPVATCTKCGEEKSRASFRKDQKKTNGLCSICIACSSKSAKIYYDAHQQELLAKKRAKEAANPEKTKADSARWRRNNRETISLRRKKIYEVNKDALIAKVAEWRKANPEKANAISNRRRAKWKAMFPDKYKESAMRAYEKRRALKRSVEYEKVSIGDVILRDGPHCYICGRLTDPDAAPLSPGKSELEHVVALSKGGSHTADNLRCACFPCNRAKNYRLSPSEARERVFSRRPARKFLLYVAATRPSKALVLVGV